MLEIHRIRKSIDFYDRTREHIFVEFDKDKWYEIESLDGITKADIDSYNEMENKTGIKLIAFTERSFQNGVIKDWDHSGWIK